jgi:hypothetical protein
MIGRQRNGRVRFAGTRVCDACAMCAVRSIVAHPHGAEAMPATFQQVAPASLAKLGAVLYLALSARLDADG